MEKIENLDTTKRMLIAFAIVLPFFLVSDYLRVQDEEEQKQKTALVKDNTTIQAEAQSDAIAAPSISAMDSSPSSAEPMPNTAPGSLVYSEEDVLVKVITQSFDMHIDNFGRVKQVFMKEEKYLPEGQDTLPLFDPNISPRPLEIRYKDAAINAKAFKTNYTTNASEIVLKDTPFDLVLTQTLDDLVIKKHLRLYPDGHYDFRLETSQNVGYFFTPGDRPIASSDEFVFMGAILTMADETLEKYEDGDLEREESFRATILAGNVDNFYTTLIIPKTGVMPVVLTPTRTESSRTMIFIEGEPNREYIGYIGPKYLKLLESINPVMANVVEYGFITFFAKPMFQFLQWLYEIAGNWGWAIVILTFVVRVVFFPLTYKGMMSMQKMKEITPKIKEIQKKYEGDSQKINTHTMELFKKNKVNPAGGCLPIFLQIPIFIAIYKMLYNSIEMKGEAWILWITDLSASDPYFILPLLMAASQFLHQHLTPTNFTDPMQEKLFKYMPLFFIAFMIFFPAGVVLYWFVNNIFSIAQQLIINNVMEKKKKQS